MSRRRRIKLLVIMDGALSVERKTKLFTYLKEKQNQNTVDDEAPKSKNCSTGASDSRWFYYGQYYADEKKTIYVPARLVGVAVFYWNRRGAI